MTEVKENGNGEKEVEVKCKCGRKIKVKFLTPVILEQSAYHEIRGENAI